MRINLKIALAKYLALFALSLLAGFASPASAAVKVGDEAPDFNLPDHQGHVFRLSDHKGEIVILFFMGYDCAPCFVEAPDVEQHFYRPLRDAGVRVMGIDLWDGSPSAVESRFIRRTGISFPILTYGSSIGRLYGANTSSYVIVGVTGKVHYVSSYYDRDQMLAAVHSLTGTPGERPKFIPTAFRLEQNSPNPFNPQTRIDYEIRVDQPTAVELAVFDLLGHRVRTLVSQNLGSGFYHAVWDGRTENGALAPAGIYFYRLVAGEVTETRTMVLMR
ncbi:hypothetical protein A2V82_07390 [candidate division KSB1 bacterium RBG_16_48_16]|nr:MAG: hypothetical protein A2V82_07390 [candidate division KSB1 bacterium RBG_16_48_16]